MNLFEQNFPIHPSSEYLKHVEAGKETIRAYQIRPCICGLARDCESTLMHSIQQIEKTGELFPDYRVAIFENDSRDATPLILADYEERDRSRVQVQSIHTGRPKWPMTRSSKRGDDMAYYRNKLRSMALEWAKDADLFIVVDLDLADWSLEGILSSLGQWTKWEVMASNGLRHDVDVWRHYDAWAFRIGDWTPKGFREVCRPFAHGGRILRVLSAFGGLALYKREAFETGEYTGGDCEHIGFHKAILNAGFRIFLNPSQIAIVRW